MLEVIKRCDACGKVRVFRYHGYAEAQVPRSQPCEARGFLRCGGTYRALSDQDAALAAFAVGGGDALRGMP